MDNFEIDLQIYVKHVLVTGYISSLTSVEKHMYRKLLATMILIFSFIIIMKRYFYSSIIHDYQFSISLAKRRLELSPLVEFSTKYIAISLMIPFTRISFSNFQIFFIFHGI